MVKFIKDLYTENDGETACPGRVALLSGVLVFLVLACVSVYFKHEFDAQSFGTGFGGLTGGGLVGIWAKSKTDKE